MLLYREFDPHLALRCFVKCYWIWQTDSTHRWGTQERILPDGCTELLFNFGESVQQSHSGARENAVERSQIAGQLSTAFRFQPSGSINLLGVRFHAHGIFPFLDLPLAEVTDRVVGLSEIWTGLAKELEQRLYEACEDQQRIDRVEDCLLTMVKKRDMRPDTHVENAVKCIAKNDGLITIEELSDRIGIGIRQLERKFALHVGISPKLYARIIRFQKIFKVIERVENYEWPGVLVDCGYYDQPHLIRDFKALSGRTPSDYFKSDEAMARLFQRSQRKTYFYNTS